MHKPEIKTYEQQSNIARAVLSKFSYSELKNLIKDSFFDKDDMIDFIIENELILDELDMYFDFESYPEMKEVLTPFLPVPEPPEHPMKGLTDTLF